VTLALVASLGIATPVAAATVEAAAPAAPASVAASPTVDTGIVKAAAVVGFNAENIISDALFYDSNAMSAAEIQSFLDSKIGACQNGKCLNVLQVNGVSAPVYYSQTTGNLVCEAITGGAMRVSEWIYRIQRACGISAKVILVTLQKEQGLVTDKAPTDYELLAAMGHECPDTARCNPAVAGTMLQIYKGAEQLKKYKATAFGKQPGRNYIGYSPNSACGGTYLNIQNYATAALYNYTPYQPNAASLAAGFLYGDSCSSYGNRNFYNYYRSWFGAIQGAVSPFGALDIVQAKPGVFRVAGWVIDPDTTEPIDVHIWVDGVSATAIKADGGRSDIGSLYPYYGANHGFDSEVSAVGPGRRTICAYGINVLAGGNTLLGCASVDALSGSPMGYLDRVDAISGGVRVTGWTIDPDVPGPAKVDVRIDGVVSTVTANVSRADIGRVYPAFGSAHGFSSTLAVPVGAHSVCASSRNIGPGVDLDLGCVTVSVTESADGGQPPVGAVDVFRVVGRTVTVEGWAWDPDGAGAVSVRVTSGDLIGAATTGRSRPDVAAAFPSAGATTGYGISLRLQPGEREVCVTAVNTGLGSDASIGCRSVLVAAPLDAPPIGALDDVIVTTSSVTARGWAIDPDTAAPIAVRISVDGVSSMYTADEPRADIERAYPEYGASHGFAKTVSASPGNRQVCASAVNDLTGVAVQLGCKAVFVPAPKADSLPIGALDAVTVAPGSITAAGWALDPDTASSIGVHIYVDSAVTKGAANQPRADIARIYPTYGADHGYAMTIAAAPGQHQVCAYGIGDRIDGNSLLGCKSVVVPNALPDQLPIGHLDSVTVAAGSITATGWTLDPDTADPIPVHVYVDSAVTKGRADGLRDDLARIYPTFGGHHGYSMTIPASAGTHRVCAYGIGDRLDGNAQLGCLTVTIP